MVSVDVSKATLNLSSLCTELRSCVKAEVDIPRSPSPIVLMVSAGGRKATLKKSLPSPASVITAEAVGHESYVCPAGTVSHTRTMYTLSVLSLV